MSRRLCDDPDPWGRLCDRLRPLHLTRASSWLGIGAAGILIGAVAGHGPLFGGGLSVVVAATLVVAWHKWVLEDW